MKDYENVLGSWKFVSGVRVRSEIPPATLSLAFAVMDEILRRPEILARYTNSRVDEHTPEEKKYIRTICLEYLNRERANKTDVVSDTILPP